MAAPAPTGFALVDQLVSAIPDEHLSFEAIVAAEARQRGRAIRLIATELPGLRLYGVWIARKSTDFIFHETQTPHFHQLHIIAHELGYLLMGHTTLEIARPYAVRLAQALQVTDILIDVAEYWQQGRRDIPAELLIEHRSDEMPLKQDVATPGWGRDRPLVAGTRQAYRAAWPGIRMLAPGGRWAVGLGSLSLHVYLDVVGHRDYDNVSSPIEEGRARRLAYALQRVGVVLR